MGIYLLWSIVCTSSVVFGEDRGVVRIELRESDRMDAPVAEEVTLYNESYALVIGIDNYGNGWPRLTMAVRDARLVAEALEKKRFKVSLRENLSAQSLEKAFKDFFILKGENPESRLFIWFAGHGHSIGDEGFLVPADAADPDVSQARFKYSALSMRRFGEYVRMAQSKHILAIFDSCFSGTIFHTQRDKPPVAVTRATTLPVRQFITSGDADQTVSDDGRFRKIFLRAFTGENIKADANRDHYLTGTELGFFLSDRITNLTNGRQTPRHGKINDEDFDRGDFVFISSSEPRKGSIRVLSDPSGADIFLKNRFQGLTPLTLSEMEAGSYTVKARLGGLPFKSQQVTLSGGNTEVVRFSFDDVLGKTQLNVSTEPADAVVRIMNIREKFHNGIALDDGKYKLEVSRSGYRTHTEWIEIEVTEGKVFDHHVTLVPDGPGPGDKWRDPVTGMEFVWIPAGCFQMGQTNAEKRQLIQEIGEENYKNYCESELPRHEVCVDGFWMGKYEVTNVQFRKFRSSHDSGAYEGHSLNGDDQPVVMVSWEDAKAFVDWLNRKGNGKFSLPTEAEWEYACRGGSSSVRYWGDNSDDACRYANVHDTTSKGAFEKFTWPNHSCNDGYAVTASVGRFQANDFGLYDMLGNVWEWCEDIYASDAYSKHSRNNPIYASSGSNRVYRGGSWLNQPARVRCAYRAGREPGDALDGLGFRLSRKP